ncbi:30S ribosomal protein S16 [Candidatus Paracaedibacter symbiosus]|uniref:30S ribosomal protein S16 n=1 Tax=Candidatus Paracaedibacter symbiosus TaxID=244582 RepID=UPI0005095F38
MALKIRLARGGSKKRPFYRVVVADAASPRDGRFVEKIGTYNPLLEQGHADRLVIDKERAQYWLSVGAQPTDRVTGFLANLGLVGAAERREQTKQNLPKKKAQERLKAEEAAKAAAAEA